MPEPVACSSPVQRELFSQLGEEIEGKSCRKSISTRCQLEANIAMHRSTEQLRERFNFDLDQLPSNTPTRPKTLSLQLSNASSVPTSPLATDAPKHWFWERVNLEETYLPSFYHTRLYHSESHLTLTKTKLTDCMTKTMPQTPYKSSQQPHQLVEAVKGPTDNLNYRVKPNTLPQLWNARIKRTPTSSAGESQIVGEVIKETPSEKIKDVSDETLVAKNEKSVNDRLEENGREKSKEKEENRDLSLKRRNVEKSVRAYRQLTLLDCPCWRVDHSNTATSTPVV